MLMPVVVVVLVVVVGIGIGAAAVNMFVVVFVDVPVVMAVYVPMMVVAAVAGDGSETTGFMRLVRLSMFMVWLVVFAIVDRANIVAPSFIIRLLAMAHIESLSPFLDRSANGCNAAATMLERISGRKG
jgi:hypothetical protein